MSTGKDPQTADGLGGVHNVTQPRAPVPNYPATPAPEPAATGPIPGSDAHMESDPDQVGKVVHTEPAPLGRPSDAAAASTARPARTPQAPFQDARVAPDQPSAWAAEKDTSRDET